MSTKLYLSHKGVGHDDNPPGRGSGRYGWGSGDNPYQHDNWVAYQNDVKELKDSGLTEKDIAKGLGFESTGDYRAFNQYYNSEHRKDLGYRAYRMRNERQMSWQAIANELGLPNESSARSLASKHEAVKEDILTSTANMLKDCVKKNNYIDVGEGTALGFGISNEKLEGALSKLKNEGYDVQTIWVQQINQHGQKTKVRVLCPEGTTAKELYLNMDQIKLPKEYYSDDKGLTYRGIYPPQSLDSSRIQINYTNAEGTKGGIEKDGVIELRPGVEDISLGGSRYAQVRILVDNKYYLKGMAVYNYDMPKGVDVIFNTNKKEGTPPDKVFKKIEKDPDNPFGATIKDVDAGGQRFYIDKNGEKKLSVINKVNDEGDWGEWDKTLSNQFLHKQSIDLVKKQLNITYLSSQKEFDDIKKIQNSEVRKKMLLEFADECDASAAHLKAEALPRQQTQVLLPSNDVKTNEVYAPNFRQGEYVCLIRYPHSGPFEILDLKVNNNNPSVEKVYGKNPKDAVIIHPSNLPVLSGADCDGDNVTVIPNYRDRIRSTRTTSIPKELLDLRNFDPKEAYPGKDKEGNYIPGIKTKIDKSDGKEVTLTKREKGIKMGMTANLITDMNELGAPASDIAKAVRHSMVIIDANKHGLNWKQSEIDNDIPALTKKWRRNTIMTQANKEDTIAELKAYGNIDKETGKITYENTGKKLYFKEDDKVIEKIATQKRKRMYQVDDAFQLTSDPLNPTANEAAYATYANQMKKLANEARKLYSNTVSDQVNKASAKAYAKEVESLTHKAKQAELYSPYDRQAQMVANVIMKEKKRLNPNMTLDEKKKLGQQTLNSARKRLVPGGRRYRVEVSPREWEAIQANSMGVTLVGKIINSMDPDKLKEYAIPKANNNKISSADIALMKALMSVSSASDVADRFGISTSTLYRLIKE